MRALINCCCCSGDQTVGSGVVEVCPRPAASNILLLRPRVDEEVEPEAFRGWGDGEASGVSGLGMGISFESSPKKLRDVERDPEPR